MNRPLRRCALLSTLVVAGCADVSPDPTDVDEVLRPDFALGTAFSDPFDSWDWSRWWKGDHVLGRSYLDPQNVTASNGELRLATPAGTYEGGEILSQVQYSWGTYRARMKCAMPRGSVCAFFLYQGVAGTKNDEIDIEILGGTRDVMFTTWVQGRRTHTVTRTMSFDPALAFHEYTISYRSGQVAFLVDGQLVQSWRKRLPTRPMLVMANAWWPTWLSGPAPTSDAALVIDQIDAF